MSRVRLHFKRAYNDVLTIIKDAVNKVFMRAEARGAIRRVPTFWTDYDEAYPELRRLEAGYEDVRAECLHLLREKDRIADISVLGGGYTDGGIHAIRWKASSSVVQIGGDAGRAHGVVADAGAEGRGEAPYHSRDMRDVSPMCLQRQRVLP